jgi:hypothetical protein
MFYLLYLGNRKSTSKFQWGACISVRYSAALLHDIQRALYAPLSRRWGLIPTKSLKIRENVDSYDKAKLAKSQTLPTLFTNLLKKSLTFNIDQAIVSELIMDLVSNIVVFFQFL